TPSAPLRNGNFLLRRSHPLLEKEGNGPLSQPTPSPSSLRRGAAARPRSPLQPAFYRRNQHHRTQGRTHDALRRASKQRPIQHSFTVDVHDEQIHLLVFERSENNPVRYAGFDTRNDVAPVPGFGGYELLKLLIHSRDE